MRLQYFPWLFDDKDAWEKSLANPYYRYDLPIDNFMSLYQVERKEGDNADNAALPLFSVPTMPLPTATQAPMPQQTFAAANPFMSMPVAPIAAVKKEEPKEDDGILSQDEIDALLSGL